MLSKDIMAKLSLPFAPDDVSWLPGRTTKDGSKVQAMAYADYRAYMNRLDEVCGPNWMIHFSPWGERIICELTVDGITRSSTGEPDSNSERNEIGGTVAEAQAMKRACAMFGLGRYLYNLPSVWVEYDAQRKQIADKAKAELEQRYRRWYAKMTAQRLTAPATAHIDDAPLIDQDGPDNPFHDDSAGASAEPPRVSDKTLRALHAAGSEFYQDRWNAVRHENIAKLTDGRTHSSKDLTEDEAQKLIDGIGALRRKAAQQRAQDAIASQPDANHRQRAAA